MSGPTGETLAPVITVNGARLQPDVSGAALDLASNTLLCADLHLEKGSAFAARGQMLPPLRHPRDPDAPRRRYRPPQTCLRHRAGRQLS